MWGSGRRGVPAVAVGDYVTALGGGMLAPLQVFKLCYMAHGYALAITGRPLFGDRIEAWEYGPVIPNLYHALRAYGGAPVAYLYTSRVPVCGDGIEGARQRLGRMMPGDARDVVDEVVRSFGHYTGLELASITNVDGSPWHECFVPGRQHARIPDRVMGTYYRGLLDTMGCGCGLCPAAR